MNPTSPTSKERSQEQSKGTVGKVMISVDEQPDTLSPSDKSVLWPTNEGAGVIGGSGQIKLNRIKKLFEQQQQNLEKMSGNSLNRTLPKTSHGRKGGVGGGFQNFPLLARPSFTSGEAFSDCKTSRLRLDKYRSETSPRDLKATTPGHGRALATAFSRSTPYQYSRTSKSEYTSNPNTGR